MELNGCIGFVRRDDHLDRQFWICPSTKCTIGQKKILKLIPLSESKNTTVKRKKRRRNTFHKGEYGISSTCYIYMRKHTHTNTT